MSYFAKTTYSARIIARKLLYPIYNSLCINLGTPYFFSEEYTPLPSKGLFGLGAVGDTVSKNITSGTNIKKPSQKISLSPEISQKCLESYQNANAIL